MKGKIVPYTHHPDGRIIDKNKPHGRCEDCDILFPWVEFGYKCNGRWITSCPFCNRIDNPYRGE